MIVKILFVSIFVSGCVCLCKAEDCETYDGNGICIERCTDGKVMYDSGCDDTLSERTCRQPIARSMGIICDYYRCECPAPKVWDEAANKCVNVDECSDQSKLPKKTDS